MKYPVEEVWWLDHAGTRGWSSPDEYAEFGLSECRTVGYLLKEDAQSVTLLMSLDTRYGNVESSTVIVKKAIVRRKRLAGIKEK